MIVSKFLQAMVRSSQLLVRRASEDGQFNRVEGVGVDQYSDTGLVYVADTGNSRIQVFKLEK